MWPAVCLHFPPVFLCAVQNRVSLSLHHIGHPPHGCHHHHRLVCCCIFACLFGCLLNKMSQSISGIFHFSMAIETTPSMLFLLLPPSSSLLLLLSFSLLLLSTSHRALHISAVASPCLSLFLSLSQSLASHPMHELSSR